MKIKNQKYLYIIFIIASLLIASLVCFFINKNTLPYEFRLDKRTPSNVIKNTFLYNDLDYDGISEEIRCVSVRGTLKNYLSVHNSIGTEIAKLNIDGFINFRWILFEDYNNDSYKEIFAFSVFADSLYLSILNVKTNEYILDRQFILAKPVSARTILWDIEARPITLQNIKKSTSKELIFYVRGNVTIYPRTVYAYDIKNKKITKQFITGSRLSQTALFDVTNDGNKEIIISTAVVGNLKKEIGYHDRTGWMFVIDRNLTPIFPPKNFGSFPGDNYVVHFRRDNQSYFYILYYNKTDTGKIVKSLLLDSSGKELPHNDDFNIGYSLPLKVTENGNDFIYIANDNEKIFKLNNKLKVIKKNTLHTSDIEFISEISIGKNNKKVLLIRDAENMFIVDRELNLLAKYNLGNNLWRIGYNFKKINGKNKLPQLPILNVKYNYLFTVVENKFYSYLPVVFFGLIILSFLLLIGLHFFLKFLATYIKYFNYSLKKSTKGIVLISSNEKILYSNSKTSTLLNISESITKGKNYNEIFKKRDIVVSTIKEAFQTQKKVTKEIQISSTKTQFEGSVTVIPFISFMGFTYAYLMEISDYTEVLLTDRGKVWGATLQRIAHEIKTPLSTLILSLDNIKSKLADKNTNVDEELAMMHRKLKQIKQLTKNFMLITNLEKQILEKISISDLLNDSTIIFQSYFQNEMILNLDINNYYVLGNSQQLSQLFPLLIENAIDACEGKGELSIVTKKEQNYKNLGNYKSTKKISNKETDFEKQIEYNPINIIKIIIKDNGKGMLPETLAKIFQPYFTTKNDGTGLGLSLAKRIIEDNKGWLEVQSEIGVGTTIIIYFQEF